MPWPLKAALVIGAALLVGVVVLAVLPSHRWFWSKMFERGPHTITYQVTGDAPSATVTYLDASGKPVNQDVALPWEMSFIAEAGAPLEVEAISATEDSITCRVKWEGHTVSFQVGVGTGHPSTCQTGTKA